ncbi:MAG: hypothetical protein DMG30_13670 [Acidobacteria bacterium]|nr:MAG: hypothetical protein DMG30_13670 [Acidobacteriota bacterium]
MEYVSERLPWPEQLNQDFMWKLLKTKSVDWEYEKEWRVFTQVKEGISDKCTGRVLYFAAFGSELILREVILGAANENDATDIHNAIKHGRPLHSRISPIVLIVQETAGRDRPSSSK